MKITAQEEYGLRCLLQVAQLTIRDELASLGDIASAEKISTEYTGKLFILLRQMGLVESVRGKNGGYKLAKPPEKIYLDEVIRGLSGELFENSTCQQFPGNETKCVHLSCCSIRSVWRFVSNISFNILKQITLKDLLSKEDIVDKYLRKEIHVGF